jgi:hypothetical protein
MLESCSKVSLPAMQHSSEESQLTLIFLDQTQQLENNIVKYNEAARKNEMSLYALNAAQVEPAPIALGTNVLRQR